MSDRHIRWRFVVDWQLQGNLVLNGLLYGSLTLVTVCGGILGPLLWALSDAESATANADQALVMIYMHERLWFLVALCLLVMVLGTLRFSHRIAGPLVRYKRNLRLLAQGKLPPPLRTRKQDYMQEEVRCLNNAVAGLVSRIELIRQAQTAVLREVEAVVARTPRQSVSAYQPLRDACAELQSRVASFEQADVDDERPAPVVEQAPQLAVAAAAGEGDPC